MADDAPEALWIPLHALFYVRDPASFAVPNDSQRAAFERDYTPEKILAIYDALAWAIAHPDHPFLTTYAKDIPKMHHDNATIVAYFKKMHEGMEPLVKKLRGP